MLIVTVHCAFIDKITENTFFIFKARLGVHEEEIV